MGNAPRIFPVIRLSFPDRGWTSGVATAGNEDGARRRAGGQELRAPQELEMELTGKQKRYLRGQGHRIKPVVRIGKQGLAPALLGQVEECLLAHELIKVKVLEGCPMDKHACASMIVDATGAQLAQTVGHTLLLYRPHPERPNLELPPAG